MLRGDCCLETAANDSFPHMSYIEQIPVGKAKGLLKKLFDEAIERAGRVWHIVHIMSQHRANDLRLIPKACREQWTNWAINQARGQRLFLAGASFAFEKPTGNLTSSKGLFLIVNSQRKKINARSRLFSSNRRAQHLCSTVSYHYSTVRLARYFS